MKNISFILISLLFITHLQAGQYGSVSGYVVDEKFKTLSDVKIDIVEIIHKIKSSGKFYNVEEGQTDKNGYYKLMGIEAGTYTIKYTFIGYCTQKVYSVKIEQDSDTEVIICLTSEDPDFFKYNNLYDGSNARISPYNLSQKNINLEKTGKVNAKEKLNYPKLDMLELYPLIRSKKYLEYPINDNIVGKYKLKEKSFILFTQENNQLYKTNFYGDRKGRHEALYNTGKNRFITKRFEIIFKDGLAYINTYNNNNEYYNYIYKKIILTLLLNVFSLSINSNFNNQ